MGQPGDQVLLHHHTRQHIRLAGGHGSLGEDSHWEEGPDRGSNKDQEGTGHGTEQDGGHHSSLADQGGSEAGVRQKDVPCMLGRRELGVLEEEDNRWKRWVNRSEGRAHSLPYWEEALQRMARIVNPAWKAKLPRQTCCVDGLSGFVAVGYELGGPRHVSVEDVVDDIGRRPSKAWKVTCGLSS